MAAGERAQGTKLKLTVNSTITEIANVLNIDGPNMSRGAIDVTHLGSGEQMDFLPGLLDEGEVSLTINYEPGGVTHQALTDSLLSGASETWSIIPPTTTAPWPFTGFLTAFGGKYPVGDKIQADITIKVDDAITPPT